MMETTTVETTGSSGLNFCFDLSEQVTSGDAKMGFELDRAFMPQCSTNLCSVKAFLYNKIS